MSDFSQINFRGGPHQAVANSKLFHMSMSLFSAFHVSGCADLLRHFFISPHPAASPGSRRQLVALGRLYRGLQVAYTGLLGVFFYQLLQIRF
jgi:hypothetical protein